LDTTIVLCRAYTVSDSVSFDPSCVVAATPNSVEVMLECYCLGAGPTTKTFPLPPVVVDSVSGTLSFYALNWPWYKRGSTAICGWVQNGEDSLLAFDIQGRGEPQLTSVYHSYPGGIKLDKLVFACYPDLTLPTDFRMALVFHRCG
jgi:hypothetical protein